MTNKNNGANLGFEQKTILFNLKKINEGLSWEKDKRGEIGI